MTVALVLSMILNAVFIAIIAVGTAFCLRLSKFAMAFEDNIPTALDGLDTSYRNITAVLELPIAYDSFEVRKVLGEIDMARGAILRAAHVITSKEPISREEEESDA